MAEQSLKPIIDKLEKLSKEELEEEFLKIGLEKNQIDSLIDYLNMSLEEIIKVSENKESIFLKEGTKELYELNSYIEALNLSKYVKFSISLARGQEYYTGTVFEAYQVTGEIKSSIGGGGRYDKMIGDFIGDGKTYPAVGISFGLDVIFDILKLNQNNKKTNTTVYIIPMQNNIYAMKVAEYLRDKNINVDIEMNNKKMKKALDYANSEEIPFVIIIGEEELKENKVVLKNMKTGAQMKVKIENIEENLIDINYKVLNPGGNKTAIVIGNEYTAVQKKN